MINQKLGSFRIETWLGRHSLGDIFRGVNESTGRTAAIKVLRGEQDFRLSRLRHTALILAECNHPNLPRVLELGLLGEVTYVAMEFIDGQTLAQVLAEYRALPWPRVVEMGVQICEILQYLHARRLVHRNLKPSHFILTNQGQVKLIGFGLAKDLNNIFLPTAGLILGTPAYMAPEQIWGTPAVSPQTDLYALGTVLYQTLVGKPPFEGNSALHMMLGHLNEPAPRPNERIHEVPEALDNLIVKLMAKSPRERPQDAAEVGNALSRLRSEEPRQSVKKALPRYDAQPHDRPLLSRFLDPLGHWPWCRYSTAEPRGIARDSSPNPYLEDPLWDRDLDG